MAEHDLGIRPDERKRLKQLQKRGFTSRPLLHRALNVRCSKNTVGYCHDCKCRIDNIRLEHCGRSGHTFTLDREMYEKNFGKDLTK